jgi:hypothetical protein
VNAEKTSPERAALRAHELASGAARRRIVREFHATRDFKSFKIVEYWFEELKRLV